MTKPIPPYSPEVRARAVRMVFELMREAPPLLLIGSNGRRPRTCVLGISGRLIGLF
jgi:hypothetical protein